MNSINQEHMHITYCDLFVRQKSWSNILSKKTRTTVLVDPICVDPNEKKYSFHALLTKITTSHLKKATKNLIGIHKNYYIGLGKNAILVGKANMPTAESELLLQPVRRLGPVIANAEGTRIRIFSLEKAGLTKFIEKVEEFGEITINAYRPAEIPVSYALGLPFLSSPLWGNLGKNLDVFLKALQAGYFNEPRRITQKELGQKLKLGTTQVNRHLRSVERMLAASLTPMMDAQVQKNIKELEKIGAISNLDQLVESHKGK